MFVKINNANQDWFINLDQIQSIRALGEYFQLVFRDGEQVRIEKSEAAIIIPLLPVPNNGPALSI